MEHEVIKSVEILQEAGFKAFRIANVLGLPENDVHESIKIISKTYSDIEKNYTEHELPKVKESIELMKKDVGIFEVKEMKRAYLIELIRETKLEYLKSNNPEVGKKLELLLRESKVHMGDIKEISALEIERAKKFPLTNLIKTVRGMAKCPFHSDKSPSLNVKNNFYFCHGCGEHGDVIAFVMKTKNLSFREAINYLCA